MKYLLVLIALLALASCDSAPNEAEEDCLVCYQLEDGEVLCAWTCGISADSTITNQP